MIPNEHDSHEAESDAAPGGPPEDAAEGEELDAGLDLNADTNPFSSVYPPGTGPFPRLLPREGVAGDEAEESEPPAEHSWIPGFQRQAGGPFDPRTSVPLPPHGWYAQVPSMEPLPDPNVLPGPPAGPVPEAEPIPAHSASGMDNSVQAPVGSPPGGPAAQGGPAGPGGPQSFGGRPQDAAQNGGWSTPQRPPAAAPPLRTPAAPPLPPPSLGQPGPARYSNPMTRATEGYAPRHVEEPPPPPARETADSLTSEALLHGKRLPPGAGWRRTVYRATGGLVRVGESAANLRRRDLVNRVRTPVAGGHHRVAVMSLKGGVGKTTTVVGLGATLASLRGDRVIAVDANPDRGTLSDKVRLETAATVRDLLTERDQVSRYADIRAFTSQAPSRLEVLASDRDPGVSVAFSADDYRQVCRMLEHYYSICITDCGTGLLHSAMAGVLQLADHIILVSSPSVDGARSASATLDWLDAHEYGDLVRDAVVVLSAIRPRSKSTVDLDRLEQHFAARCRAVIRIPYDPHLEEGAEVELDLLSGETAEAYLTLGAVVGDGFAVPRRAALRTP